MLETTEKGIVPMLGQKQQSLVDSLLLLASKVLAMVVKVDSVKALGSNLKKIYVITAELSNIAVLALWKLACPCFWNVDHNKT